MKRFFVLFIVAALPISLAVWLPSSTETLVHASSHESSRQELFGYATSPIIGAVSFNCADTGVCGSSPYRVVKDVNNLKGYAWSSSVGWIRFDPVIPPPFPVPFPPEAPYNTARIEASGVLTGWTRACSVFEEHCFGVLRPDTARGGWDGWIKLSGTVTDGVSSYGVRLTGDRFGGYAWGATNVGWLNFDGVTLNPTLTAAITANSRSSRLEGGTIGFTTLDNPISIAWTSGGGPARTCEVINASGTIISSTKEGVTSINHGVRTDPPYTYTVTCRQSIGGVESVVSDTVKFTVSPPPVSSGFNLTVSPNTAAMQYRGTYLRSVPTAVLAVDPSGGFADAVSLSVPRASLDPGLLSLIDSGVVNLRFFTTDENVGGNTATISPGQTVNFILTSADVLPLPLYTIQIEGVSGALKDTVTLIVTSRRIPRFEQF